MGTRSTSVTGDAVNINNFEKLIFFAVDAGLAYAPTLDRIKLVNMQAKLVENKTTMADFHDAAYAWVNA